MTIFHAYRLTHNYESAAHVKGPDKMTNGEKVKAIFFGVKNFKSRPVNFPDTVFETVNLKTKEDLKIEGWYIRLSQPLGTVIMFHGHGGNKSGMLKEATTFTQLGYSVMMVDFRAHGNSEGTATTIGKYEAEEVKLTYDFIKSKSESRIILWGTSMGAVAICSAFNDYSIEPSAVILEMPFASLKKAVSGRVSMMGIPKEPVSTS